jgi:DNA polymerase-3 subunit delta'
MEWNVIGHEWAARLLQEHIANDEARHAYLFTGPAGIGRRTLALRFAQALNCSNPPAAGLPCGACRACQQIEREQHTDLSVVQSDRVGAELKIDAVRDLQRSLSLAPYESRYKVALLLRFHEANANAQNALLKTLEEAPRHVILLLTADSAEDLLPTIVSRCEVLRLRPQPLRQVESALQARWGLEAAEAAQLAHFSAGCLGTAVRLHQQPELLERRRAWLDDLWEMLAQAYRGRFSYAEKISAGKGKSRGDREVLRENLHDAYRTWLSFWRDVMLRSAGAQAALVNIDIEERVTAVAARTDLDIARRQVSALEKALARLNNANLQLLTEVVLMDWPRIRY